MDNRVHKTGFILFLTVFYLGAMLIAATPSEAKWWVFGKKDDTPEFSSIKFNAVSVENVDEQITLSKDNLEGGEIIIRGRAEVGEGTIGKVEVSFDGGEKWQKATLGDRGMFTFEFKPEFQREYDFRIKALSTTGKSSDLEDHSFMFLVDTMPSTDQIKAAFMELLRLYMEEDRVGFMRLIHPDFEGDLAALEDAISDDFLFFDNIKIEPNIVRILPFDGNYELYFTFNRQVQVANSGKLLKDSAASSMTFARGSGFLLFEMAAPLIFGVSNPAEIATNVTEEAIGNEVIGCNESGDCGLAEQGDDTDTAVGGEVMDFNLNEGESFSFSSGNAILNGDFGFFGTMIEGFNALFLELNTPFESTNSVPAGGNYSGHVGNIQPGQVFAVEIQSDSEYAIIQILNITNNSISFRYKYPVTGP